MTKKQILSFFLGVVFILSGCASSRSISTEVTSNPSDAEIYWGEAESDLKKTDYTTPYLQHHSVSKAIWKAWYFQVKKEGYKDSEVIFQAETKEDRSVHFELEPLVTNLYCAFKIVSDPTGAHVVEKTSGEYIGRTPIRTRYLTRDASKESTEITQTFILKKKNYLPSELTLNLSCIHKTKYAASKNVKTIFTMLEAIEESPVSSTVAPR